MLAMACPAEHAECLGALAVRNDALYFYAVHGEAAVPAAGCHAVYTVMSGARVKALIVVPHDTEARLRPHRAATLPRRVDGASPHVRASAGACALAPRDGVVIVAGRRLLASEQVRLAVAAAHGKTTVASITDAHVVRVGRAPGVCALRKMTGGSVAVWFDSDSDSHNTSA